MNEDGATMRIGEVARRAGVNVSLVRYYDPARCATSMTASRRSADSS